MFNICCRPKVIDTGLFVKTHIQEIDKDTAKVFGEIVKELLLKRDMEKLEFGGEFHFKIGEEIYVKDRLYCTLVKYKGIVAAMTNEGRREFFKVREYLEDLEKLSSISSARKVFGL